MTDRTGGGGTEDPAERRTEKVDLGTGAPPQDAGDDTPPSGTPAGATERVDTSAVRSEAPSTGETRGRVRYQDPATTTPREPTVAEQRARREAQRRERAQADAAAAAEERKRKTRKRVLVGGGVAVGVAALVAVVYAASQPDEVTARCVDANDVVQPDEVCASGQESGGYYSGGTFVPIFIGGFGGGQYHYNYGPPAAAGTRASGGSVATPPSGTSIRGSTSGGSVGTSSGGSVARGGLGVGGGSGSSSSGSGSSSSGS